MKKDTTTILGWIFVIGAIIVTIADQILSIVPEYTFELIGWHILAVLATGMSLIVMPQDKLVKLISDTWEAIVKKFV